MTTMNTEPGEREETPRPIGWQTAQIAFDNPRMVKVVFETPECAEAFIDSIEPADGPIVAATRMRERCVARVKEYGKSHQLCHPLRTRAAVELVEIIESLTHEAAASSVKDSEGGDDAKR